MLVLLCVTAASLTTEAGPRFLPRTFSAGSSESPQGLNSVETILLNQTIEVRLCTVTTCFFCFSHCTEGDGPGVHQKDCWTKHVAQSCYLAERTVPLGQWVTFTWHVRGPDPVTTLCTSSLFSRWQDGDLGALTYFWITGDAAVSEALIRVYIDGELEPSLTYQPAKVRVGLNTRTSPHALHALHAVACRLQIVLHSPTFRRCPRMQCSHTSPLGGREKTVLRGSAA